ncbi:UDP-3-O-acyl-N-acetylglucosamine deacetylase [Desulfurobacterium atlanticum]|uniref:UDP-3-O-acyl-N-acetylglucosamine deacetylase n=1 Tax=Desulfurobacterium atlanticum TaxID=240169 RepID=A0A238XM49_9BACT|nr:UDP-3-O-acyl-N-acetylglucosamine deacetylase [Desulfurobacterium atlanticum]SNR59780.1 UDP-3-O-[3-hydroxymyristoyl] N-acetylglucosamine deacetylase [Desulfurobacterium atlanticum]
MQIYQQTVAREITFSGIGLHTGEKVNVRITPAPPDTGIVFIRNDIESLPEIKVSPENTTNLFYATNLEKDGIYIKTVEHLLAALSAFGIDNLYIFIDNEEVPILDGSAAPYIYLFESAGIKKQNRKRKYLKLKEIVEVKEEDKYLTAIPSNYLSVKNTISFNHTYRKVQYQTISYTHSLNNFVKLLAKARTFCFVEEVEWLKSKGLAKGGSLDNAIVIDKYNILNPTGLRMENEFVAHKTLDLIGDLYVLGFPLLAEIEGYKTGHALNAKLVKEIYARKCYELVELDDKSGTKEQEKIPGTFQIENL